MIRHSVIVYRSDNPGSPQPVSFDGDSWRGYVPIGVPDTVCVRDNLPAGAAAVLINRTHTYTDIVLPIDAQEERLVDAIDGHGTIEEIAGGHGNLQVARSLFRRLWRYDQIMLDASRRAFDE